MGKALVIPNVDWSNNNLGQVHLIKGLVIMGDNEISQPTTFIAYYNGTPTSVDWSLTGSGTLSTNTGSSTTVTPNDDGAVLTLTAVYNSESTSKSISVSFGTIEIINYLRSNGKQMIQTDYFPSTKMVMDIKFKFNSIDVKQQRIFSNSDLENTKVFQLYLNGSGVIAIWHGSTTSVTSLSGNTHWTYEYHIDTPKKTVSWSRDSGAVTGSATLRERAISDTPLRLFSDGGVVDSQYSYIDLYYIKIYEDNILVCDYEPRIKNGTYGLLNLVTGIFYSSVTDTPFTGG